MNQAIKIIDEMIEKQKSYIDDYTWDEWSHEYELEFRERKLDTLIEVKDRISSLTSLDIDSLQRYTDAIWPYAADNWEYVLYDDLLNLLNQWKK